MEFVTTMFAFFMLFGIVHAKEWEPKIYAGGANATIRIEQLEIDEKNTLEITFSGFISKQHVTNVMLYAPKKNQSDNISININYKGRIEMIKIDKSSLSFLLLNVDFVDSGNYTVSQDSQRKGATSIFVPRHRLLGINTEPMVVTFTCNITYSSSIKIEMMISKNHFYVLKYDVTRSNCTEEGNLYRNRIESCVLKGPNFSFTIRQINLFDMGMYVAWDDRDILMDSVFVEFEGNNTTSNPGKRDPDFSSLLIPNISDSREEHYLKHEMYMQGENATICIDQLKGTGKRVLEITFSSYTSKLHAILVMLYNPMEKQADYNRKYTGRIKDIKVDNSSFSFILQYVSFVDSGNYTAFEDSREFGKASIIIPPKSINSNTFKLPEDADTYLPIYLFKFSKSNQTLVNNYNSPLTKAIDLNAIRYDKIWTTTISYYGRILLGNSNRIMMISFMYNTANISAIKIDMIKSTINILVVMYDVAQGKCTEFGRQYMHRIQNCVFSGKNFSFTIREFSWLDKGMYAARDATNILLDSVLVDIQVNNGQSSTEVANGYFNSSCITNPASSDAENEVWARLLFAAVGAAVTVPLTVTITLLIIWIRGSFPFSCMKPSKGPQEAEVIWKDLKMGPISKNTINSADADEREYEEPHSNTTLLSIYLEPIGIDTAHTENDNPGGSGTKVYEKLHPYGNQENNTYSSLGAEHIPEVSKRPII